MVVMNMICIAGFTLRSRCAASMPESPGMSMSMMTSEKREVSLFRNEFASRKRSVTRPASRSASKASR